MAGLVRGRARGEGGRLGRRLALERGVRRAPGRRRSRAAALPRGAVAPMDMELWPLWVGPQLLGTPIAWPLLPGPYGWTLVMAPMGGPYC